MGAGLVLDGLEGGVQLLERSAVGEEDLDECLELECGGAEGSSSQRRNAVRPDRVMVYTVRARLPVCSSVAVAKPASTRRFGSS